MKNGNKINEKVKDFMKQWEELNNYLIQQTSNLIKMDVEKLAEIRDRMNVLQEKINNTRQNIDNILKAKIPPKEKIDTPVGTVVHVYTETDKWDYKGMKEYLKEKGKLEDFKKGIQVKDYIMIQKKK